MLSKKNNCGVTNHSPFLIARSIQSICCSCWIVSKFLLENSQNWKLSKLKVVRIESCQIVSCQNCKLPKFKIAKIASCQSWKWFHYFISIFDELSWKLPKFIVAKIESCQNWRLPKLKVGKIAKLKVISIFLAKN